MEFRPLGWTPISVLGPKGRTVADTRLLFALQIGMNDAEPPAFALDLELVAAGRPADLGRLRVAWTEDFGQCEFGEADRAFDVIRALVSFAATWRALRRRSHEGGVRRHWPRRPRPDPVKLASMTADLKLPVPHPPTIDGGVMHTDK